MIEVRHVDSTEIAVWCCRYLRPYLTPDVSNYARGRQRCWLGDEPPLGKGSSKPGVPVDDATWSVLERWIEWRFDYCLVTFSGNDGIGILPHRDASFANYEGVGWNLSGQCCFRYWEERISFGRSLAVRRFGPDDPPTCTVEMVPGTLVRFNTKNLHSASPTDSRWGMNFWRAK